MPRYGTEKIYLDIKDQLIEKNIKMGRDKTLIFCRENNLLVPKTKRYFITTDSNHDYEKPKNIIKDLIPTGPEQVFVTDITYIKLAR
jgi:putative transposase